MAMGIVSTEDFELEVKKFEKKAEIVSYNGAGRGSVREIPDTIRKIASEAVLEGSNGNKVAELLGISRSSVSAYAHDATSTATYHKSNSELESHNDKVKERISGRARGKLMRALHHLTDEKLGECKARDLASIAGDMAKVMDKMSPKENKVVNNNIIFYSPNQTKKDNFEVIDV